MTVQRISFLLFFFVLLSSLTVVAQNPQTRGTSPFDHLTIAGGMSTLGGNLEFATPLSSSFLLKVGFSTYTYSTKTRQFNLRDPYGALHQAFGQNVAYSTRAKITNFHTNIVLDYYPIKEGLFYISGGFYIGKTKLDAKGTIVNRDGSPAQLRPPFIWPELEFNGQKLDVINGRLDAEFTLGNTIKPYLGIGLGRAVPKNRWGIKMEIGVMYAGDYTLEQKNNSLTTKLTRGNNFEKVNEEINWFKYYPMAKFQVQYRLF